MSSSEPAQAIREATARRVIQVVMVLLVFAVSLFSSAGRLDWIADWAACRYSWSRRAR